MGSLKAFTLIETIVSSVILTLVITIGVMTYLNYSASMTGTYHQYRRVQLDHLVDSVNSVMFGTTGNNGIGLDDATQFLFQKHEIDENLFEVYGILKDSARNLTLEKRRLFYEP